MKTYSDVFLDRVFAIRAAGRSWPQVIAQIFDEYPTITMPEQARKYPAAFGSRLAVTRKKSLPRGVIEIISCKVCGGDVIKQGRAQKYCSACAIYKHRRKVENWRKKKGITNTQRNQRFINRVKLKFGCKKCSYKKCAYALCFHHRESKTKKFEIGNGVRSNRSLEALKEEIRKCDILCCNCHQEFHYGELEG